MRRVPAWSHHYEIVPCDLPAIDPVTGGDEFRLSFRVVYENQIGIVTRGGL